MLSNRLKISDTTKTEFFVFTFFESDQEISQKYCRVDLSSVSNRLPC